MVVPSASNSRWGEGLWLTAISRLKFSQSFTGKVEVKVFLHSNFLLQPPLSTNKQPRNFLTFGSTRGYNPRVLGTRSERGKEVGRKISLNNLNNQINNLKPSQDLFKAYLILKTWFSGKQILSVQRIFLLFI